MSPMRIIGLTGNIACGKSTVARMLKGLGARVIDADEIARSVVEPGERAWGDIVEKFGEEVLNDDRTLNREKLGEIIFNDDAKRNLLNEITHPRIIGRIRELVKSYGRENAPVVIIEAALIVEKGGMKDLIDKLIVVTSDEKSQMERLTARNGYSREEALSRIKAQMPLSDKVKHADYVIENSATLENLRIQVESLWERINAED
ncbi:MAG: dephospho-CoA kinase [Deltaproteobacteria bacterium]